MQNCARRFVLLLILLLCGAAEAQMFSGTVVDAQDAPVANAIVVNTYGAMLAASGRDGRFSFHLNVQGPIRIEVRALGYDTANTTLAEGMAARIVLTRQVEQVVVTAYRSPLETLDSPASARVLNQQQLREAAAPALDGKLRQVPGSNSSGGPARWWPTPHRRASLCADLGQPLQAARSLFPTMCPSMIHMADGSIGRNFPNWPCNRWK